MTFYTLEKAGPGDAANVKAWFDTPQVPGENVYKDQKWGDWWIAAMCAQVPSISVFKLLLPRGETIGVVACKKIIDQHDHLPAIYLQGLKVDPRTSRSAGQARPFRGAGRALVYNLVLQSMKDGCSGVILNSSPGAEGFYRAIGMTEGPKTGDGRCSFSLKGEQRDRWALNATNYC